MFTNQTRNSLALLVGVLLGLGGLVVPVSAGEDVALAIVFDTSGSMNETVRDKAGKSSPKDTIARRALDSLVARLSAFVTNAPAGSDRRLDAALYTFTADNARELSPLGKFDPAKAAAWSKQIPKPGGGTPLGNSLQTASRAVLKSKLSRKHVLVITDGMNTIGPAPEVLLKPLLKEADTAGTPFAAHFIAFDVNANVFAGVKKLGATVLGAADEAQLNTQLSFILEEKILLEAEEPAKK